MPDLHDLDHFDEGLPTMNPLPAADVRERGDRMRRRRTTLLATGGALAVALAVGAPVLALSGRDGGHDVQPAPNPKPSAGVAWVTSVPPDFPLTDGFPAPAREASHGELPSCGTLPMVQFADNRIVTYTGQSEDTAQRMLVLFEDDAAARDELVKLKRSTSGCAPTPVPGGGARTVVAPVPLDHVAPSVEETYAFAEQVHYDDGLVSDLTLVEVSRVGNALYVDSRYGAPGGDGIIAEELPAMERASRVPLAALCAFAAAPC